MIPASDEAGQLDAARRSVEGRFLEAGEVLAQAAEGLGRLVRALDQIAGALDPASVTATTEALNEAAERLLALPEHHGKRRRTISGLANAGAELEAGIEDMGRNLAYLRAFATNVKITAAGIDAAGSEFAAFAQEICDRIALGRDQLTIFEAELGPLLPLFTEALRQEDESAHQCAALLPAVPDRLVADAASMAAHHRRIADAAGTVGRLARSVQGRIGQALAALQIGDITRQRIEHVGEIMDRLQATEGLPAEAYSRLEAFVCGLIAAQLHSTSSDFHRDIDQISQAMSGMAADADAILRLRDLVVGRESSSEEGFLRRLEGAIGRAQNLIDDMAGADRLALTMGECAAEAAAGLGERVAALRSIKTDVQQMALNTTLKCARIGDAGKPLAVIAVELRIHAGHMEVSAQVALSALERISQQAGSLTQRSEGGTDAQSPTADIGAALFEVSARLRLASETVEADLLALAGQGESVVSALQRAAGMVDLRYEIGRELDEAADGFAARACQDASSVTDLAEPLGAILIHAATRYTMASERDVQDQIVAGLGFELPKSAARAA
jgi:hypothetical protein